ncbi:hypothetical protein F4677DRAFT_423539 [Hypoxylon crocopeplum]|nr:hypothetical protein F4677DRAFT_423539 [Hypoxylon crocopeplum]
MSSSSNASPPPIPPPSPPQQAPTQQPAAAAQQQQQQATTNPFLHNVALGVTPVALIALLLPPRRLDARAVILGGVALWGTNQLVYDYSGTSTLHRVGRRVQALSGTELPEKAKETQMKLRAERARKLREASGAGLSEEQRRMLEEQERQRRGEGDKGKERGVLERVWMGDSGDDWKEKRDRREKEALSEGGGGYWGLIMEQISEVWSGKKKEEDGGGEKDRGKGSTEGESKRS